MAVDSTRIIRKILLVIACVAMLVGIGLSKAAAKERAHDITKIKLQIVSKESYYNPQESPYVNGCYYIKLTYRIKNNTDSIVGGVSVKTYVYDKTGTLLATIDSSFGGDYHTMALKPGESATKTTDISHGKPENDDAFVSLYCNELSDFRFEYEVTWVYFDN